MNRCLRCDRPWEANSLFCDQCYATLREQRLGNKQAAIGYEDRTTIAKTSPTTPLPGEAEPEQNENKPSPDPSVQTPQTSLPLMDVAHGDTPEQTMGKLQDAAHRIAAVEQQNERHKPHASRLSPLRDMSAEIQRQSTPMLKASKHINNEPNEKLATNLADVWSWLPDIDEEEVEGNWKVSTHSDPLSARHFPNSAEALRIEQEDMHRARAAALISAVPRSGQKRKTRLRRAFTVLAMLAVLALVVDGVLLFMVIRTGKHTKPIRSGVPNLTLSTSAAKYGQSILLHMRNFPPLTQVYITHDIQEPVVIAGAGSLISVNKDGSADVSMFVDNTWEPGFHTVDAEDVATRYTADASFQVVSGPIKPPHLFIDTTLLDLGSALQGANTIRPLVLRNTGSATITWSASSNQPWLMLAPNQGNFSDSQKVFVGGQRANLKEGDYKGIITFTSNVGTAIKVTIQMSVRPLPSNPGPVLVVTPPVLSFMAIDGDADPMPLPLTINNPGSRPLHWSLVSSAATGTGPQFGISGSNPAWLSIDRTAGTVAPNETAFIKLSAHSRELLPGTYTATLVFNGDPDALNNGQNVSISLTVQQRCGLMVSTGAMFFTTVIGQGDPGNQALNIAASASCPGATSWNAVSSAPWLVLTPTSGQVDSVANTAITVGVHSAGLQPGVHIANICIMNGQNTQSVLVQITVQAPPSPNAPVLRASPMNVSFSAIQGQGDPPSQTVTIKNAGSGRLIWHTTASVLVPSWLRVFPTMGQLNAGETGQETLAIGIDKLTPGNYVGQVIITATDEHGVAAGGSPQTISINLTVLPPCSLSQPSSRSLAFNVVQGGTPAPQAVSIAISGNCSWPVRWQAAVPASAPWLKINPPSGTFTASNQAATFSIAPDTASLGPGTYSTQVSLAATDFSGQTALSSPQTFSVTLTVLKPCVFQTSTNTLSFSVDAKAPLSTQTVNLSNTGSCSLPVSWSVAVSSQDGSGWLNLSAASGVDSGSGSFFDVSVNATSLSPGTYHVTISVSATGSSGAAIQGSPQSIAVTLTVAS